MTLGGGKKDKLIRFQYIHQHVFSQKSGFKPALQSWWEQLTFLAVEKKCSQFHFCQTL